MSSAHDIKIINIFLQNKPELYRATACKKYLYHRKCLIRKSEDRVYMENGSIRYLIQLESYSRGQNENNTK